MEVFPREGWIERFSRLEDAEGDVGEFTHHGADDELGRLAVGSEAFAEALAPLGFVECDHGGHVERAAQEGMADLGEVRPAADAAARFMCCGLMPAKAAIRAGLTTATVWPASLKATAAFSQYTPVASRHTGTAVAPFLASQSISAT